LLFLRYFSEQIFIDMYTDISHFNEDAKQSSATCQNTEKTQCLVI